MEFEEEKKEQSLQKKIEADAEQVMSKLKVGMGSWFSTIKKSATEVSGQMKTKATEFGESETY